MSTVTCLVTPVAHSDSSSRIRSSESDPGRTRPIGPRDVRPAAEERLEHVAEAPETTGESASVSSRRFQRIPAQVDDAALLRIAEHLVGGADLLELRLRSLVGIDVGMQFPGAACGTRA